MSRIRLSVALVSALMIIGLLSVPAPALAVPGFALDLQPTNWSAAWTWVVDWLDLNRNSTSNKEGMQMDPDGAPDGSDDNRPVNDPPAANAVQLDAPELATSGGD